VTLHVDPRDLAYWDTETGGWTAPAGSYTLHVGTSSAQADLKLREKVRLAEAIHLPASAPTDPQPVQP
jgi:hypothetical protein